MNVRYLSPLLFLCLMSSSLSRGPDPIDHLRKIVYPLYESEKETQIQCLGTTLALTPSKTISVQVTAGHCGVANRSKNRHGGLIKPISEKAEMHVQTGGYDIQIHLRPYCGEEIPDRIDRVPNVGDEYFAFGHTSPHDQFDELRVVRLTYVRHDPSYGYVFARLPCDGDECLVNMEPGVSGGPIIDRDGNPVGFYNGFLARKPDELFATPLFAVVPFIRSAARNPNRVSVLKPCGGM